MPGTAAPKVTVEGLPEVTRELERFAASASDVRAPSGELGRRGKDATLLVVPRLTGDLATSIGIEVDEHGVALGSSEKYAPFPEFGTRYQLAQRYLRAGFEAMSEAAPEVYGRFLSENVKRTGG